MDDRVLMLVGLDYPPDAEAEFNKWYNERHVPIMLQYEGIQRATRCKVVDPQGSGAGSPKLLTIYEFKDKRAFEAYSSSPVREAAAKDFAEKWGGKGAQLKMRAFYDVVRVWEK